MKHKMVSHWDFGISPHFVAIYAAVGEGNGDTMTRTA